MLLSIDPGKSGAYALFDASGNLLETYKVKVPTGQRLFGYSEIDYLWRLVMDCDPLLVVMEGLLEHRMSHQSPKAMNTTAINWGIQYSTVLPYVDKVSVVPPREWKKGMGLSGQDKQASVELARQLVDPSLLRKERMRTDNVDIAEAILIGIYSGTKELGWEQYPLPQQ